MGKAIFSLEDRFYRSPQRDALIRLPHLDRKKWTIAHAGKEGGFDTLQIWLGKPTDSTGYLAVTAPDFKADVNRAREGLLHAQLTGMSSSLGEHDEESTQDIAQGSMTVRCVTRTGRLPTGGRWIGRVMVCSKGNTVLSVAAVAPEAVM